MPRKPRIDIPGYYHVINRGVNREALLLDNDDKEKFLEFLDSAREVYQLTIHAFCIMDNHYHLLLETARSNLSLAMRHINSRYAAWFNNKMNRVGPLWQGRFKSWFIHDEDYLWLLLRYIEMNPVKAGIAAGTGEYPYSTSYYLTSNRVPSFLTGSCLLEKGVFDEVLPLEKGELRELADFQSSRYENTGNELKVIKKIDLVDYFSSVMTRQQRNALIFKAFGDGYKQSEVSRYLNLSTVAVSRIIDKEKRKHTLFREIRDKGLFWSYADDIEYSLEKKGLLIETVLKFGDMVDIRRLLGLFGKKEVRDQWEQGLRFDRRFKKLNYFLARIFFNMDLEADDFDEVRDVRAEKLRLLAG